MSGREATGRQVSMRDLGFGQLLSTKIIAVTGVMLAVVFVMTRFVQISIGAAGYIHLGDIPIYVAAFLFGPIVGLIVGGLGTAAADFQSGYAVWGPGSLIIHGIQGLVAGLVAWRADLVRMVVAVILGGIIIVGGYFTYMLLFAGALGSEEASAYAFATTAIVPNTVQALVGAIVSIPVVVAVRRAYPPIERWSAEPTWVEERR